MIFFYDKNSYKLKLTLSESHKYMLSTLTPNFPSLITFPFLLSISYLH